jgi:hypothetical protein
VRLPGRNPLLIGRIAASHGAEILVLRHPKELLAVCRERNLGLQEPVVEALLGDRPIDERRRARLRKRRNRALRVVAALLVTAALGVLGLMVEHTGPQGERDLYGRAGKVHVK